MPTIHQAAASGFGAMAATYATGRPEYPAGIEDWLRADLGLGSGKIAVDLGAGTGKFLPRLRATDAHVIAVEPVAAMREQLTRRNPGIEVKDGSAEHIPLTDGSINAVVCAQSFHWFATRPALAEIHRVLKPGGVLGLVWNVRDESVPWVAALTAIMRPYEGDTPRYTSLEWRRVFPADGFGDLREQRFPSGHIGSPEHVIVDRVLSVSFVAALPAAERTWVAARVRDVIATSPDLAGRTEVTFPYETVAFSCTKTG